MPHGYYIVARSVRIYPIYGEWEIWSGPKVFPTQWSGAATEQDRYDRVLAGQKMHGWFGTHEEARKYLGWFMEDREPKIIPASAVDAILALLNR